MQRSAEHLEGREPRRPEVGARQWIVDEGNPGLLDRAQRQIPHDEPRENGYRQQAVLGRRPSRPAQPRGLRRGRGEIEHEHGGRKHHRAFLAQEPEEPGQRQGHGEPHPGRTGAPGRLDVDQQSSQDSGGGEQVRASGDARDGFGADRVNGKQGRREERGSRACEQPPGYQGEEERVDVVHEDIDPVISLRTLAVGENGVVEQIGQRGDGPVQPAVQDGRPVVLGQDAADVRGGRFSDPQIVENPGPGVLHQRRVEGIPIRGQRDGAEQHERKSRPERGCPGWPRAWQELRAVRRVGARNGMDPLR